jgi:hypothetical protein
LVANFLDDLILRDWLIDTVRNQADRIETAEQDWNLKFHLFLSVSFEMTRCAGGESKAEKGLKFEVHDELKAEARSCSRSSLSTSEISGSLPAGHRPGSRSHVCSSMDLSRYTYIILD